jgi:hypothetical protein
MDDRLRSLREEYVDAQRALQDPVTYEDRAHMVTLSASGALDIVPLTSARQFTFDVALGLRY